MNYEDYCSYELSIRLKEKGFDWKCFHYWRTNGFNPIFMQSETPISIDNRKGYQYPSPTISQAQKWLRDEKQILVLIFPWSNNYQVKIFVMYSDIWQQHSISDNVVFNNYEQALSAGIERALELI